MLDQNVVLEGGWENHLGHFENSTSQTGTTEVLVLGPHLCTRI